MPKPLTILLIEDTPPLAQLYEEYLRNQNYDVATFKTGQGGIDWLNAQCPAAVVLDLHLPDISGLEVLVQTKKLYPDLPVIVVTVNNSLDVAVQAMQIGASDYIVKPFQSSRLTITLKNVLEHKALAQEVIGWRQAVGHQQFYNFVGQSPLMQGVYRTLESVADSKASVFLLGESGTGKDLAALALHRASSRRLKSFIPINCAAIPRDLMESALFGHVRGSFSGAICDAPGAAKLAHGGTLFLDEICELSIDLQTKLLRFVQTGEILPIGGLRVDFVDVRIICATNRDPVREVQEKRFREDLFYRLHVVPIEMPPLRERGDDLEILSQHFLAQFSAEEGKHFTSLNGEVLSLFRQYDWPGNVRQLENVLRRIVVLHQGSKVTVDMLPREIRTFAQDVSLSAANQNFCRLGRPSQPSDIKPLWLIEKEAIHRALAAVEHDIPRAAALLEISPSTIYRKLHSWQAHEPGQAAV